MLLPTSHILVHCYNKLGWIARARQQSQNISHSLPPMEATHRFTFVQLPVTNSQIALLFMGNTYTHLIIFEFHSIAFCLCSDFLKIIEFHEESSVYFCIFFYFFHIWHTTNAAWIKKTLRTSPWTPEWNYNFTLLYARHLK